MERERNNTGLVVAVTVLIMLVLSLVGFIVYDKVINNNTKDPNSSDNNENEVTYINYDLDEAKKLIDIYYGPEKESAMFFDGNLTEEERLIITFSQMKDLTLRTINCKSLSKEDALWYEEVVGSCVYETEAFEYSELNAVYKNLFGSLNNAPKKGFSPFKLLPLMDKFKDSETIGFEYYKGEYVGILCYRTCGSESYVDSKYMYEVASAKIGSDESLIIEVDYIGFEPILGNEFIDDVRGYESTYDGAIVYDELSDISDNYIKENPNKVHRATFTFEKENGNFVLKTLEKKQ